MRRPRLRPKIVTDASTALSRQFVPYRATDRGAGVVEYALLVALIALVCLASIQVLGGGNSGSINKTADRYASATS